MKKTILSLLLITSFTIKAQKQANLWYFGLNAGADFSTGTAVALTNGALYATEGTATICDPSGNLLFYTDGITIWNKNHIIMPAGTSLMGGGSSTQPVVIVPLPGSNVIYYVFTTDETGNSNGFRYSVVDMTLDGGQGDVISKNNPILTPVTERLTAIRESFGANYWVAVHEWGSNAFVSYKLSSTGLSAPVKSFTGIVHTTAKIMHTYGQMKFSPCGNKLAVAAGYLDTVQVFDFNENTGVFSNPLTIPIPAHVYGIEFSPDGSKLYVSTYDANATLVQYDLSLTSTAAILASKTALSTTVDTYGLQIAVDGKIYVCKSFSTYLGVINFPNVAGTGCSYNDLGFNVDPNSTGITTGISLPEFVQTLAQESSCLQVGVRALDAPANDIKIFPNPFKENISIENPLGGESLVTVYTPQGQEVFSETIIGNRTLNMENLSKGMYFLHVQNGKAMFNFKIIK